MDFLEACEEGCLETVQEHIKDLNIESVFCQKGFHLACMNDHVEIVKEFVKAGPVMELKDKWGRTGFHLACLYGCLDVVKELIKAGQDLNVTDKDGRSGLSFAYIGGHLDIIKYFLEGLR